VDPSAFEMDLSILLPEAPKESGPPAVTYWIPTVLCKDRDDALSCRFPQEYLKQLQGQKNLTEFVFQFSDPEEI